MKTATESQNPNRILEQLFFVFYSRGKPTVNNVEAPVPGAWDSAVVVIALKMGFFFCLLCFLLIEN